MADDQVSGSSQSIGSDAQTSQPATQTTTASYEPFPWEVDPPKGPSVTTGAVDTTDQATKSDNIVAPTTPPPLPNNPFPWETSSQPTAAPTSSPTQLDVPVQPPVPPVPELPVPSQNLTPPPPPVAPAPLPTPEPVPDLSLPPLNEPAVPVTNPSTESAWTPPSGLPGAGDTPVQSAEVAPINQPSPVQAELPTSPPPIVETPQPVEPNTTLTNQSSALTSPVNSSGTALPSAFPATPPPAPVEPPKPIDLPLDKTSETPQLVAPPPPAENQLASVSASQQTMPTATSTVPPPPAMGSIPEDHPKNGMKWVIIIVTIVLVVLGILYFLGRSYLGQQASEETPIIDESSQFDFDSQSQSQSSTNTNESSSLNEFTDSQTGVGALPNP